MFKKIFAGALLAACLSACPQQQAKVDCEAACPKAAGSASSSAVVTGGTATPGKAPEGASDDEAALYFIAYNVGIGLRQFDLKDGEKEIFRQGFFDSLKDEAKEPDMASVGPMIQRFVSRRSEILAQKNKKLGAEYLAKAAAEPNAEKTPEGFVIQTLTEGTGAQPVVTDRVKVHYTGTLIDGTKFDSSYDRKGPDGNAAPATFPLLGVIKCWGLGIPKMKVGGKSRLVCPAELAYGDRSRPRIPGGSTLVFEVELLEILTPPPVKPLPSVTGDEAAAGAGSSEAQNGDQKAATPNPIRPVAPTGPGGIPQNPPGQPQWRK